MTTPTVRQQTKTPYTEFPRRSFMFYGEPKTGKTTAASQFPNPLLLNVLSENGTGEIEAPVIDIETPSDLLDVVNWLRGGERDYQTIILDGASTFVLDEITRHPSRDQRKSIKDANVTLIPALHAFLKLPHIRVITAHAKRENEELEIERRAYNKINVFPNFPPSVRLFLEGRLDAYGYCYAASDGQSNVWWTPYDSDKLPKPRSIVAGNRLGLIKATNLSYNAIRAAIIKEPAATASE